MNSPPPPRRPLARRLLRGAAVTVVAVELLYLVGMNVFLSTPLFEKVIDFDPVTIDIHFARAWSFFPTHVHAEHLSIRSTDGNVQWILKLDEVTFDVSLPALARQTFHVTHARGSGITFLMRLRMPSPAQTPELTELLAPIDGLGPAAFKPSDPPYAGTYSDADWHLWTVHLEDVVAEHVREIWVDRGKLLGDTTIKGGFYLKPIRAVEVGPIDMDLHEDRVRFEDQPLIAGLDGHLMLHVERFDPRPTTTEELIHHISLNTDLRMAIENLQDLAVVNDGARALDGRVDVPKLSLRIARGVLADGTQVDVDAPNAQVKVGDAGGHAVDAAVSLHAKVADEALSAGVDLLNFTALPAFRLREAHLDADSRELDLADPFGDAHATLALEGARSDDVRALMPWPLRNGTLKLLGGTADGSAHFEAWRREAKVRGDLHVGLGNVGLASPSFTSRGEGQLSVAIDDGSWETGVLHGVKAVVLLDRVEVSDAIDGKRPMFRANGALHAAATTVDTHDPLKTVQARLDFADVTVFDEGLVRRTLPDRLTLPSAGVHAAVRGDARLDDHALSAAVDLLAPKVAAAFNDVEFTTKVSAHVKMHELGSAHEAFAVDQAELTAERVTARGKPGTERDLADALTVGSLHLLGKSSRLTLAEPLRRWDVQASVDEAQVHDAETLNRVFPVGVVLAMEKGGGRLSAGLVARKVDDDVQGGFHLRAQGLGAGNDKVHLTGDLSLEAQVDDWNVASQTLIGPAARVVVTGVKGAFAREQAHDEDQDFAADQVTLHAWAPSLGLATFDPHGLEAELHVGHAELPDATALNRLIQGGAILAVESGRADVAVDLRLSPNPVGTGGKVIVRLENAGVRLHDSHLAGNFGIEARLRDWDEARKQVTLSGSEVLIRDAHVTGAASSTAAWYGNVVLEQGFLRFDGTPHLEGDVVLGARDASPVLALLLGDGLPGFVTSLTKMPRLDAMTHLVVEPSKLVVAHAIASGGDIALRGAYMVSGDTSRGAFVVHKAFLSAGVALQNGGVRLRLFGLDGWLHDQTTQALAGWEEEKPHAPSATTPGPSLPPAPAAPPPNPTVRLTPNGDATPAE